MKWCDYCQKHLCCRAFSLLELNNSDTHCDGVFKEPVRRKWGLPTTSSLLVGKKNKTKEEMNTTKSRPALVETQERDGFLLFRGFRFVSVKALEQFYLFRRFLIQIECNESIKQIRYPHCDERRYIAIHCKRRSNRLEQNVRET